MTDIVSVVIVWTRHES